MMQRAPWIVVIALLMLATAASGQAPSSQPAATAPADLDDLLTHLGDDEFAQREDATRRLIALGPDISAPLSERLADITDPEVRYRVRFILDNLAPPSQAALIVRADEGAGVRPGELITHVNGRRVRRAVAYIQRVGDGEFGAMLRVRGRDGPRDVGPITVDDLPRVCDFRAPRGPLIAEIVRLYADGFAEQAYERMQSLPPTPENEFSPLLRAIIAQTAGDGAQARALLESRVEELRPPDGRLTWYNRSGLTLAGPLTAPLALERLMLSLPGALEALDSQDPDLPLQRVLVPARRYIEAACGAIELWSRYEADGARADQLGRVAGNFLAVTSWMLSELDLQSECIRLIEPRSEILGWKWMRVQLDAWPAFLAGDLNAALERSYPAARDVLEHPPTRADQRFITRRPDVAAGIAFFLYQAPQDPRVLDTLRAINRRENEVLSRYAHWMIFSLNRGNQEVVRRDLAAILPNLPDDESQPTASALLLLEYLSDAPDHTLIDSAIERLARIPDREQRAYWLAVAASLQQLRADQAASAAELLATQPDNVGTAVLQSTARFISQPPPGAENHPPLRSPRLAVPIGTGDDEWLVLTRERRLVRFSAVRGDVTPLRDVPATWMPGPVNWPWIGRDPRSGRVWLYDRHRVLEVCRDAADSVRLNLRDGMIGSFDRLVAPHFGELAAALAAAPQESGENGEFRRADLRSGIEYVGDPDLRELAVIAPVPGADAVLHVGIRGGPQLLIDAAADRTFSTGWVAQRLDGAAVGGALRFFPHGIRPVDDAGAARAILLFSDVGLLKLDLDAATLQRLSLPGDAPLAPVIPESAPYERRDPRWVYFARLPQAGGQVFRLRVVDGQIEPLDMVNEILPEEYYRLESRASLRLQLDAAVRETGQQSLDLFIEQAVSRLDRAKEQPQP
ncbi:hypothetical protein RAS1_09510 [Phycisphaerae bacterium RAS1]|nr:hypothetical protein RAS1_09510 [Phycisphaerae bacterium RAS1]